MATKYIEAAADFPGAVADNAGNVRAIFVDTDTEFAQFYDKTAAAWRVAVTQDQTQTLTNKTLTTPTLTTPTLSSPTITGTIDASAAVGGIQAKASTASFDVDDGSSGSTLTNVTGLTAFNLVAGATYKFKVTCSAIVQTTNGGSKAAFKLTTATLTTVNARVRQSTDTDNTGAVSTTFTTTTDQATWFDQKAVVYTSFSIEGTLVVGTAGTIAVQLAQNAAHADNTTVLAGAIEAQFTRIS